MSIITAIRSASEIVCARAGRLIDRTPRFAYPLAALIICAPLMGCGVDPLTALDPHFQNMHFCIDGAGAATMRAADASFTGTASNLLGIHQLGGSVSISGMATYGDASGQVSGTTGSYDSNSWTNSFDTAGGRNNPDQLAQVGRVVAQQFENMALYGEFSPNGSCGVTAIGVPTTVMPYYPPAIIVVPGRGYPRDRRYKGDGYYDRNRGYDRSRDPR